MCVGGGVVVLDVYKCVLAGGKEELNITRSKVVCVVLIIYSKLQFIG